MFLDPKGKQLLSAILNADIAKAEKILQSAPASIDFIDVKENTTPLLSAIKCRNMKMIRLLTSHHADVNRTINNKDNPLIRAINSPNALEIVQHLIECGANVNYENRFGFSPLSVAIRKKDISLIELLIQKGVRNSVHDAQKMQDELSQNIEIALQQGKPDVAQFIISCGLNTTESAIRAIKNNRLDNVKYLLQHGADATACLKAAGEFKNYAVLKSLIPVDDFLHAAYDGNLKQVKILHGQVGDINMKDEDGHTALYAAVMNGNAAVVDYLLKNGADPSGRYNLTFCPFHDDTVLAYLQARGNVTLKEFLIKITSSYNKDTIRNYAKTLKILEQYDTSQVRPELDEYFVLQFKGIITQTAARTKVLTTKWYPVCENPVNLPVSAFCVFRNERNAEEFSKAYADIFKEKLSANPEYKSGKIKTQYRCSTLRKQEIAALALDNQCHVIIVDPVRTTDGIKKGNFKFLYEEILNVDQFHERSRFQ